MGRIKGAPRSLAGIVCSEGINLTKDLVFLRDMYGYLDTSTPRHLDNRLLDSRLLDSSPATVHSLGPPCTRPISNASRLSHTPLILVMMAMCNVSHTEVVGQSVR